MSRPTLRVPLCIGALTVAAVVVTATPAGATDGDLYARRTRYCASTYSPGHTTVPGFGPPLDLNASGGDHGRPVYAPTDGRVTVYSRGGTWGLSIIWTSTDGLERIHVAHLDRIVHTGRIRTGEMIGRAGSTGHAFGEGHLHVARQFDGRPARMVLSGRAVEAGRCYVSAGPVEVRCLGLAATILGTKGNDRLVGTTGDDVFGGLAGNDRIDGQGGNDRVCSGPGDDRVSGGRGNDRLSGGPGVDVVGGGGGADRLDGGAHRDRLAGKGGRDLLSGGPGGDRLDGGSGVDTASYGSRATPVTADPDGIPDDGEAGEGDNVGTDVENLGGGSGNDILAGNAHANALSGGRGHDALDGADGRDSLDGGPGTDSCLRGERSVHCP